MLNPNQVLEKLLDGNRNYVNRKLTHPHQDAARLRETAVGQNPMAIILGCSDSRVPPEVIFDQGLGDLFVIRVAGNILDDAILGSMEYAAAHFGVALIVVMGHERCGAIGAAVKYAGALGAAPGLGHISTLIQAIQPALGQVKQPGEDWIENAVRANVQYVVGQIQASEPLLAPLVQAGKLKVVGLRYDLDDGEVTLLDPVRPDRADQGAQAQLNGVG
jgi:carbonic anhydrase